MKSPRRWRPWRGCWGSTSCPRFRKQALNDYAELVPRVLLVLQRADEAKTVDELLVSLLDRGMGGGPRSLTRLRLGEARPPRRC